ncbi:MAG TPA: TetR/AcrR family transcriptional regulator [Acidimicrobiales bacterium]|nr:TetR/AcrR family transcriptional regulator [Acidimicrobiales bacterium]
MPGRIDSRIRPRLRPAVVGRPPAAEREARRRDRAEVLLDAAEAAVRDQGEAVTMAEMAARAGITKPVLYRYFGDRSGLYEALAVRYATGLLGELRQAMAQRPAGRATLEEGIDAYLRYTEANVQLYRFLATRLPAADPAGQKLVSGFLTGMADEVSRILRESLQLAGIEARATMLLGYAITGSVQMGAEAWISEQGRMGRSQAVTNLTDLVWHGLIGVLTNQAPEVPEEAREETH